MPVQFRLSSIVWLLVVSVWCLHPTLAQAQSLPQVGKQAGVVVSVKPPQASAEAVVQLPSVYVLPGSFLYWFKHVIEEVQLILATSDQQRAGLLLTFSQRRLEESYQAINEGKVSAAIDAMQQYQQQHQEIVGQLEQLQQTHPNQFRDLIKRLQDQLKIQDSLHRVVGLRSGNGGAEWHTLASVIDQRPSTSLAELQDGSVVLGAHDQRLAASPVLKTASPSATIAEQSTASAQEKRP
jgi:hypothetical protein